MKDRQLAALAPIGTLACVLAACSARTDVSLTGNTPLQYSHVWITTQEVWFNSNAGAGPDDDGWVKFPLSTPSTVDLVAENGGNLGSIVTDLKLVAGSYSQVRVVPVDPSEPLTTSAQTAGAIYNAEADYVDSSGITHQLPLELLNPDKGIGIQTSLKVPVGKIGAALAATPVTSGTTGAAATTTTGTTTVSAGSTSSAATQAPNSFAVVSDGTRDLVPFSYATTGSNGVLLSSHATAYDLSGVGGISGQLTLTNLIGISGSPDIQVSAQTLSADGTRHVIVSTTPVHSDGSFLLYPLATSSSNPASYDVVIHGPGIATIIIKSVQLTLASSPATTTTGSAATASSSINSVSIGTLTPRAAASYTANLSTAPAATLPPDARVEFCQTLAAEGEVPYVIEASPIDPFNEVLASPQGLSTGTVDSGTWASSGAALTLVSAAPAEKAGTYIVTASAPSFADAPLTSRVSAPAAGAATPVSVVVPALALASGIGSGSLTASVTESTAGKYDGGALLVTQNGTLVASASLAAAFAQGGAAKVTVNTLPARVPSAAYYVTVLAWDSSGTLHRQWYPALIDLRSATSGVIQLTVN